jgi:hypothetical protein
MTTSIFGLIVDSINTQLEAELRDKIPDNDPTKAGLVRPGLLQDDPTVFRISVLTFENDPVEPNSWPHEIVSDNPDRPHNPPPYQIGGLVEMWWRRFKVELKMFFPSAVDRQTSRLYGGIVLARAERALSQTPLPMMADDFGEGAIQVRCMKSTLVQGGGEGQFIYDGYIWCQVLTEKDYS